MPMNRSLIKLGSAVHGFWYAATGGIVGAKVLGAPVLLLTTTGRKSGRPRTAPLMYMEDGDNLIVVGSNGGNAQHPAWFLNLRANPDADVQIGRTRRRVRAEVADDAERARLWPKLVEMYGNYDEYQKETSRTIPVVILRPAG
jgi:deazaflavin-dependent oxidoreductase (nitroreductase family)